MSNAPAENNLKTSPFARRGKIFYLLIFLFLLGFGVFGIYFNYKSRFVDFPVYYYAGQSLLAGRTDIYAPGFSWGFLMDYRYPPLFLLLVCPLSLLSYQVAANIWWWLSLAQIVGCVWFVQKLIRENLPVALTKNQRVFFWLIIVGAVGQYFFGAMKYGNAQLLITFLIFASFYFSTKPKSIAPAAALMALAITIKIMPALALPFFAVKKQWRYLVLTGAFVILFNLLPAVYFGFGANLNLLGEWFDHVVIGHAAHEQSGAINLSLRGQLRRTLTEIDYRERVAGTESADVEYEKVNVAAISDENSDRVWLLVSFILFAAAIVVVWLKKSAAPPDVTKSAAAKFFIAENFQPLEFGLICCLIPLINPLSPKFYFIILLLPVFALANYGYAVKTRAANIAFAVVAFVAVANFILPLIPGRAAQRYLLVIGTDFYAAILLTAVLFYVLIFRRRDRSRIS